MTQTPAHLEVSDDFTVVYAFGNENAPTSKIGQCILTLKADGSAHLENKFMGTRRAWTGKIERPTLVRLAEALNAASFPVVPDHQILPGPVRTVVVRTGGQEHFTYPTAFYEAKKMVGYKDAYRLLDSIIAELTGNAISVEKPPEIGLVSEATPAT